MDSRTTSDNTTFKPISVTAAEAWVRDVGMAKMPVPSVSLDDVKRAFIGGYELANSVRERESLLLQAELREAQIDGPRIGALEEAKLFVRYLTEEASDAGSIFEFREACKYRAEIAALREAVRHFINVLYFEGASAEGCLIVLPKNVADACRRALEEKP